MATTTQQVVVTTASQLYQVTFVAFVAFMVVVITMFEWQSIRATYQIQILITMLHHFLDRHRDLL